LNITPEILNKVKQLPLDQQTEILRLLDEYEEAKSKENCRESFISFVERVWPSFISGRHHKIMGEKFEQIASGKLKRLIICMPPRHTKSEFGSYLFPSWFLGKYPHKKVIQTGLQSGWSLEYLQGWGVFRDWYWRCGDR